MVFQRYIKAQLTTQMVQTTSPHALPPMHGYMALPGILLVVGHMGREGAGLIHWYV